MSEIDDLLEAAMYKEIASQAQYIAGQKLTDDTGAVELMKELADEEARHLEALKKLKEKGVKTGGFFPGKIKDLKLSEYLSGGTSLEDAGLQDTLSFAIKREQQAMDFYSDMMGAMRERGAKQLCQRLVRAELGHKYKLENLYDKIFYRED